MVRWIQLYFLTSLWRIRIILFLVSLSLFVLGHPKAEQSRQDCLLGYRSLRSRERIYYCQYRWGSRIEIAECISEFRIVIFEVTITKQIDDIICVRGWRRGSFDRSTFFWKTEWKKIVNRWKHQLFILKEFIAAVDEIRYCSSRERRWTVIFLDGPTKSLLWY